MWKDFLITVKLKPTPTTLYQHLTTIMFREEISKKMKSVSSAAFQPLPEDEGNALRYTAGYIRQHLRKQLKRGNHAMKEELVLCLMELIKDKDSDKCDSAEEWTVQGRIVKNTTYLLFVVIEEEVRKVSGAVAYWFRPQVCHYQKYSGK